MDFFPKVLSKGSVSNMWTRAYLALKIELIKIKSDFFVQKFSYKKKFTFLVKGLLGA